MNIKWNSSIINLKIKLANIIWTFDNVSANLGKVDLIADFLTTHLRYWNDLFFTLLLQTIWNLKRNEIQNTKTRSYSWLHIANDIITTFFILMLDVNLFYNGPLDHIILSAVPKMKYYLQVTFVEKKMQKWSIFNSREPFYWQPLLSYLLPRPIGTITRTVLGKVLSVRHH